MGVGHNSTCSHLEESGLFYAPVALFFGENNLRYSLNLSLSCSQTGLDSDGNPATVPRLLSLWPSRFTDRATVAHIVSQI